MRHIQVKITKTQAKIIVPLAIDLYEDIPNEETNEMEYQLVNKAPYKGLLKVTTNHDVLYFREDSQQAAADAILTTNIRGCKALYDKVRKAK